MAFKDTLIDSWRRPSILTWLLWPLSQVYRLVFLANRSAYKLGLKKCFRAPVPVIIIGNITVGGTGKTPLVIFLVEALRQHGYKPGVISRGYSGNATQYPLPVTVDTPVDQCGDEPALIVRRTGVPMCVGPSRRDSIELLLKLNDVDLIISDDGLQHFALQRDIEVCLVDETSPMSNTQLLPSGPYREPKSRLASVDFVIQHGGSQGLIMSLEPSVPRAVTHSGLPFDKTTLSHAIAGIGNPQRFFNTCRSLGLNIQPHSFPDHHKFIAADINFGESQVLMTEKDAVKCQSFADQRHWYLPVDAKLSDGFVEALLELLRELKR